MPDIDSLMQEWPADVKQQLRETGLPTADLDCDLPQYVDIICSKYITKEVKQNVFSKYSHWKNRNMFLSLDLCTTYFVSWTWIIYVFMVCLMVCFIAWIIKVQMVIAENVSSNSHDLMSGASLAFA